MWIEGTGHVNFRRACTKGMTGKLENVTGFRAAFRVAKCLIFSKIIA